MNQFGNVLIKGEYTKSDIKHFMLFKSINYLK